MLKPATPPKAPTSQVPDKVLPLVDFKPLSTTDLDVQVPIWLPLKLPIVNSTKV